MNEKLIEQLIQSELKEVDAKWPDYHNHHEAYAVIKEEVEELSDEMNSINNELDSLWRTIRYDKHEFALINYNKLKASAKNAIKEAVQVYITALRAERLCKTQK